MGTEQAALILLCAATAVFLIVGVMRLGVLLVHRDDAWGRTELDVLVEGYAFVVKGHGDASFKSFPGMWDMSDLTVGETDPVPPADPVVLGDSPSYRTVYIECGCGSGWYVANSTLDPCPTCGEWEPLCTEVNDPCREERAC